MTKKKICLIYTGGTIGMVRHIQEDGNVELRPPEDRNAFKRNIPEISELVDYDYVPVLNLDSSNLLPEDWVTRCNEMDEVWTTTHAMRDVFINSGVTKPVYEFKLGVDPKIYFPKKFANLTAAGCPCHVCLIV